MGESSSDPASPDPPTQVYVEDVASALRIVADEGSPVEAYNVAARRILTLDERLRRIADALGTDVELVHASERELIRYDLAPTDFPLVRPKPVLVEIARLAVLGRESARHAEPLGRPVEEHLESDRTGRHHGPDREVERPAIDGLTTRPCTNTTRAEEANGTSDGGRTRHS